MLEKVRAGTAEEILDVAERLVQTRGFNGFSYADISEALRIRKASIHYHFPTKSALGESLMRRYRHAFAEALARIDRGGGGAPAKLKRYARLYVDVLLEENRMCLCGMLAADFNTLPDGLRAAVTAFFDDNERWLTRILEDGRKAGALAFAGSARARARLILSTLEGAMLVARTYRDSSRLRAVTRELLDALERPG